MSEERSLAKYEQSTNSELVNREDMNIGTLEQEILKVKKNNLELVKKLPVYGVFVPASGSAAYFIGTLIPEIISAPPGVSGMFVMTTMALASFSLLLASGFVHDSLKIVENSYSNHKNKKLLTQKIERESGQLSHTIDDTVSGALSEANYGTISEVEYENE